VTDASARVDLAAAWGVDLVPSTPGRDTTGIIDAAASGELKALVVGGVELDDLPDPQAAAGAVEAAGFVVSLEVRASAVTARADVVFPVAPISEREGTFVNWEGRVRPFGKVIESSSLSDVRVLSGLAEELGSSLGFGTADEVASEMRELGPWDGERPTFSSTAAGWAPTPGGGAFVLATWRTLIDDSLGNDGEQHLLATGRRPVAVLSEADYARLAAADGKVTVSTDAGSVTVPAVTGDIAEGVVWLPSNTAGANLHRDLRAHAGSTVRVEGGAA
jgi:NADH-quinone oxidoreductase subunit G